MRGPRRCGWCRSLDHRDRRDKHDRPICPERVKFEVRLDRARALRDHGDCVTCGDEPATVEFVISRTDKRWIGQRCAAMFEQLSRLLGGNPQRRPRLEVVRRLDG